MDERDWTDEPLAVGDTIHCVEAEVTRLADLPMWLITGDLSGLSNGDGGAPAPAGLADPIDLGAFSIRIGRDRWLAGGEKIWADVDPQSGDWAASRADGLYSILQIAGPHADQLIAHGSAADVTTPSPSVAVRFTGLTSLLVRNNKNFLLFIKTT